VYPQEVHLKKVADEVPSDPKETVQVSALTFPQIGQVFRTVGNVFSFNSCLPRTAILLVVLSKGFILFIFLSL